LEKANIKTEITIYIKITKNIISPILISGFFVNFKTLLFLFAIKIPPPIIIMQKCPTLYNNINYIKIPL